MGDFSANFKRPDAGIHTVEGTVSGARAATLEKKRQRDQDEFLQKKLEIEARGSKAATMAGKFASAATTTQIEQSFKDKTVGLVTAQQFKELVAQEREEKLKKKAFLDTGGDLEDYNEHGGQPPAAKKKKTSKKEKKKKLKAKKKLLGTLSFAGDEEEAAIVEATLNNDNDDDNSGDSGAAAATTTTKTNSKKDPTVDTSFLPDKARDWEAKQARAKLEREWKDQQKHMQEEQLEITYSYWDGSGHRRTVVCQKGDSIGDFLEKVRVNLAAEQFKELGSVGADALLYVKEDLIIPQDLTFYDLIATKARGKSGPLFHFDVHDDVRVGAVDTRVEKDESHPGKVVERRWYDRNKHIFPASRWELYDPQVTYGSYTIGDFNKKK